MAMFTGMDGGTTNVAVPSPLIVNEPLSGFNYKDWSIQLMTYLKAKDLWEVVETDQPPQEHGEAEIRAWNKKNAAALHAIQISCESNPFSLIREISLAKVAWKTLAEKFATIPFSEPLDDNKMSDFKRYKPLFDAVYNGNWNDANGFLNRYPDAVRATIPSSGKTVLHVAVTAGHLEIVEQLVGLMSNEDLEMQRLEDSFTALTIAIDKGNISMAKCMVNKNKKLLAIAPLKGQGYIPVVHAVCIGKKKLARYLYSVTPLEVLTLENGTPGSELLYECIYTKDFGT